MSVEFAFRCPVCRASQTLRDTCRRCQADLRLVVCAHRRVAYLEKLRRDFLARDDRKQAGRIEAELRWLAPARDSDSGREP